MADYTLEDIEALRAESGISYEEAIALLDLHRGNLAAALKELRESGRTKGTGAAGAKKKGGNGESLLQKLYAARVTLRKGDKTVLNVSSLCAGVSLLVSPHLVVGGAIASLALGYHFGFNARDEAFVKDDIGDMVRTKVQKVKSSVDEVTRQLKRAMSEGEASAPKEPVRESAEDWRKTHSAPVIRVPVKVESPDGSVSVTRDDDGFTSATIE